MRRRLLDRAALFADAASLCPSVGDSGGLFERGEPFQRPREGGSNSFTAGAPRVALGFGGGFLGDFGAIVVFTFNEGSMYQRKDLQIKEQIPI